MVDKTRRSWEELSQRSQSDVNCFEALNYRNLVQFQFFQLPREIRDHIYFFLCGDKSIESRLCFDSGSGSWVIKIISAPSENSEGSSSTKAASQLQQLQVSRQFYEEAATIFYSTSCFQFGDAEPFASLISGLPSKYQSKIRNLDLKIGARETKWRKWRSLLKHSAVTRFSGLRVLQIRVWVANKTGVAVLPVVRFYSSNSLPTLKHGSIAFHKICHEGLYWEEGSFVFHQQDIIFKEISEWLA